MNNVKAILFIILLVGIVWYAATLVKPRTVTTAKQPTTALFATVQNTSHCQERGGLPDPECTPGAANPSVDQSNISTTICRPGFSGSVRPPVSYTEPLKKKQVISYGYADTLLAHYEEDHLVSIELGGSPTDPANLWPEPMNEQYGSKQKDTVENYLHSQVCSGALSLGEAQSKIATDWIGVYQSMPQSVR